MSSRIMSCCYVCVLPCKVKYFSHIFKLKETYFIIFIALSNKFHFFAFVKTILRIWDFYYEGFRNMTIGRTLWLIILVKLFIIFVVLKAFFFPNYIKEHAQSGQEAEFVSERLKP